MREAVPKANDPLGRHREDLRKRPPLDAMFQGPCSPRKPTGRHAALELAPHPHRGIPCSCRAGRADGQVVEGSRRLVIRRSQTRETTCATGC